MTGQQVPEFTESNDGGTVDAPAYELPPKDVQPKPVDPPAGKTWDDGDYVSTTVSNPETGEDWVVTWEWRDYPPETALERALRLQAKAADDLAKLVAEIESAGLAKPLISVSVPVLGVLFAVPRYDSVQALDDRVRRLTTLAGRVVAMDKAVIEALQDAQETRSFAFGSEGSGT